MHAQSSSLVVAYLCFFDGGRQSVTHGADVESLGSFQVSLTEELGHDAVGPLLVERQRLGWVAEVGAVHEVLQHLRSLAFAHHRLYSTALIDKQPHCQPHCSLTPCIVITP